MDYSKLAEELLFSTPVLKIKIDKACSPNDLTSKDILVEVLRFMHLVVLSGERLTPSQQVDLAWHEFILFTKLYSEFCNAHFGRFIHHYPAHNDDNNKEGFRKLHYYYKKHIGLNPNPKLWGKVLIEIADDSDCGTEIDSF